jgi:replication-associated recombination protein RarA
VPQQYRPSDVETRVYYRPGAQGREDELGELLERRRSRRQDDVEGNDVEETDVGPRPEDG